MFSAAGLFWRSLNDRMLPSGRCVIHRGRVTLYFLFRTLDDHFCHSSSNVTNLADQPETRTAKDWKFSGCFCASLSTSLSTTSTCRKNPPSAVKPSIKLMMALTPSSPLMQLGSSLISNTVPQGKIGVIGFTTTFDDGGGACKIGRWRRADISW